MVTNILGTQIMQKNGCEKRFGYEKKNWVGKKNWYEKNWVRAKIRYEKIGYEKCRVRKKMGVQGSSIRGEPDPFSETGRRVTFSIKYNKKYL